MGGEPLSQAQLVAATLGFDTNGISVIPPWLAVFGIIFATLIGLISGFYPANRAVRISALEASKHE
jgi:ABC-type antimicrobial peptide transport system permease subunit